MRTSTWVWLRMLVSGTLVFGSIGAGCTAEMLRLVSGELDDLANQIDNGGQNDDKDFDDILDDIESWF